MGLTAMSSMAVFRLKMHKTLHINTNLLSHQENTSIKENIEETIVSTLHLTCTNILRKTLMLTKTRFSGQQ